MVVIECDRYSLVSALLYTAIKIKLVDLTQVYLGHGEVMYNVKYNAAQKM